MSNALSVFYRAPHPAPHATYLKGQEIMVTRRDFLRGLATSVLLSGCAPASLATPDPVAAVVAGSTSMLPLSIELAAAYHAAHPHVFIEVRGGDSDIGLKSLQGREVQMAAVSWRETGTSMPGGLQAVPVARDGLALIVHPDNRIARLTSNQVRSIYRGETLTWKALGGLDAEPAVVSREDGSGSRKAFETLIMSGQRLTLDALVMPSSQTAVDYVAHHPAAVAYVSSSYVDERVQPIQLEGVMPTLTTLLDGSYRLTRLLYLCTPYPAPGITQGLLDFALSPSGQALIARRYVALH